MGTVASTSIGSGRVGPWTMLPGWMVVVFIVAKKPMLVGAGVDGLPGLAYWLRA